jgi:hypothetical protein
MHSKRESYQRKRKKKLCKKLKGLNLEAIGERRRR